MRETDLHFFDRSADYTVAWKDLPHWAQNGAICFITWRVADSLPASAQREITAERVRILASAGIKNTADWKTRLAEHPAVQRSRVQWALFAATDRWLDRGAGACLLRKPAMSAVVLQALQHFDGDRYLLTDAVVMPNHVHVLVAFRQEDMLLTQCTSWKRYTALKINQLVGATGKFWQTEQFDHLVRGPAQLEYFQRYIADNPRKARLRAGEYRWYSPPLGGEASP